MRLLHIITGLETGGAERMLLKLAPPLRDRGFTQEILSLTTKGDLGARFEEAGFPVHAAGLRRGRLLAGLGAVARTLRAFRPDIAQTWLYHADLVGGAAARLLGVPRVVWNIRHSVSPHTDKRTTLMVARACAALSHGLPDGILYNSTMGVKTHLALGYDARLTTLLPNGFETDIFHKNDAQRAAWRARWGVPPDALLVGWAGRFHPQKACPDFLQAVLRVIARNPRVYVVAVGRNITPENPALSAVLEDAPGRDRILLQGPCSDMPGFLASLDVFVSSSVGGEGFPNVLAEAMCCEIPCVVTDAGDSAFVVGETGTAVPPADPGVLAQALLDHFALSAEERKALGARARARVLTHWSIEAVADAYARYYKVLL